MERRAILRNPIEIWNMQEYREYLKYNLKYAGIWNIMEYNAHMGPTYEAGAYHIQMLCTKLARNNTF